MKAQVPKIYKTKVLIVGGGLAGLTLAAALNHAKIPYICVDKMPLNKQDTYAFDGRTTSLSASAKHLYEHIGIWDSLREYAEPMNQIHVAHEDSKTSLNYHYKEVGYRSFGHVIENRYLRKALAKKIKNTHKNKCLHLAPESLISIKQEDTYSHAFFESGLQIKTELIVAADGGFSLCRTLMGIDTSESSYNHHALIALIDHEYDHQNIGIELFRKDGPFALLPMRGKQMSVIWCETPKMANFYKMPENQAYAIKKLEHYCAPFLGKIKLSTKLASYPLSFMEASSYIAPRMALIGEAIHKMHPIAGQGFNVSIRDIASLYELLSKGVEAGEDLGSGSLLTLYQRRRKFDIVQLLATTDFLTKELSSSSSFLKFIYDIGFEFIAQNSWLRAFLMLDAMGLTGRVPPLLLSPDQKS